MRLVLLALALLAACGRINFDPPGGSGGDGGGNGDATDGDTSRANVVFVTTQEVDGAFGGIQAADEICRREAADAGLPGTFVAFLSDSTTNAYERIGGSRGWVLPDGRPVLDSVADPSTIPTFNPINRTASGARITVTTSGNTWTGTDKDTTVGNTCLNWTSTPGSGTAGAIDDAHPTMIDFSSASACNAPHHLYCFELGHDMVVRPPTTTSGRVVFVSGTVTVSSLNALDTQCQTEAMAAGLPGTFIAAVATTTASARSRFGAGLDWYRVDGTLVLSLTELSSATDLLSFVNQLADGTYVDAYIYTGSSNPSAPGAANGTCSDWTTSSNQGAVAGYAHSARSAQFWGGITVACNASTIAHVLCMQR